jgi:dTMP kinase
MEEAAGAMAAAESPQALLDLLLPEGPRARGLFLSMEGVDGCSKSTQQQALVAEMQRLGWEIVLTREPGGEEIAEKIRQLILDPGNTGMQDVTEAYLYAASRAQNARMRILPALERGEMVICDRYVDSSIAYQGGGRQLGMDRIRELNAWATENCMPDLTVYLRMEPHEALARRLNTSVPDRLEREQDSFFQRTFEAYEKLYDGRDGWRVVRVNAASSIEAVTQEMLMRVRQRLADLAKRDRQNGQE